MLQNRSQPGVYGPSALGPIGQWAHGPMGPWAYGPMGPCAFLPTFMMGRVGPPGYVAR